MDHVHTITFPPPESKPPVQEAPKKSRVVTQTSSWTRWIRDGSWNLEDAQLQWHWVQYPHECPVLEPNIKQKIRGYRSQDLENGLYEPSLFVDYNYVMELLEHCRLQCFYCHIPTMVIYEHVRDPRQWTLERTDNAAGHNYGNVEIACLKCNLRRRTMHQERYILTKKMVVVNKLG